MTHTLVVIRHGKSDWSGDPDVTDDFDRPLAKRGRRQAPESGLWIATHLTTHLDLAVVSPAARARETWELMAAEIDAPPPVRLEDRIYSAWGRELLTVVRELPDDAGTVALVGHNPGVEDLVADLTGTHVSMPTSAVAVVELPGPWADAGPGAVLRAAGRPPT